MAAPDNTVILNSLDSAYLRANQHESGGWVFGPARPELFTASDSQLTKVSEKRGVGPPSTL